KYVGGEGGVIRRVALHVKRDGLLAAAGDDLVERECQRQRLGAADLALDGVIVTRFDAGLLKELLSLDAAVSAVAMAEPVDFDGHGYSPNAVAILGRGGRNGKAGIRPVTLSIAGRIVYGWWTPCRRSTSGGTNRSIARSRVELTFR